MRLGQIPTSSEVIAPLNILSLASSDLYKHSNFQRFHKFNSVKITDETVLGEGGGVWGEGGGVSIHLLAPESHLC